MTVTSLPTGTVTFLFTDIEGSTRLLQKFGADYPALLTAHAELIRAAIAGSGGIEVSTEGDACFVVFNTAASGLAAAVESQRALAAHSWPSDGDVKVRMGSTPETGHSGVTTTSAWMFIGLPGLLPPPMGASSCSPPQRWL